MTSYTFNPPQYQAIQWTGENLEDVESFLPSSGGVFGLVVDSGNETLYILLGANGYLSVPVDSWMVITNILGNVLTSDVVEYPVVSMNNDTFEASFTTVS
jgi:hypothetical protein